jgi:hypothetical protein
VRRSRIVSALSPIRRAGDYSRVDFVSCLSTDAKEHAMKGHVSWVNELAVKDGALEPFRELMEQMVTGSSAEPGTLDFSATSASTERRDDTAAFLGSEGTTTKRQEL